MQRVLIAAAAGVVLSAIVHAAVVDDQVEADLQVRLPQSVEQPFVRDGSVRLMLSSGDYVVRAGASDRIRVEWRARDPKHEREMKDVTVRADVSGTAATIRTEGPTSRARLTIETPGRSHIYLRMRAGDVRIEGIDGDKDVEIRAGDLHIDIIPESLSRVHASVTLGDLRARPLGIVKDGIRNSLDWTGDGVYTIDARLFAGDLTLVQTWWLTPPGRLFERERDLDQTRLTAAEPGDADAVR